MSEFIGWMPGTVITTDIVREMTVGTSRTDEKMITISRTATGRWLVAMSSGGAVRPIVKNLIYCIDR